MLPFLSTSRYFTANIHSAYLVAIPKKAASHIQKSAPGPPALRAVATPTMLPVPTVAARAVHKALKLLTSPSPSLSAVKISFNAIGNFMTWIKPNLMVSRIPVPRTKPIRGKPHTYELIAFKVSNIFRLPFLNKVISQF